MIGIIVIISTVAVLIASILLYKQAVGDVMPHRLNMLSYSYYSLALYTIFASVIAVVDVPFWFYDPLNAADILGSASNRLMAWAIVMWMFLGIPLGALMMNGFTPHIPVNRLLPAYRRAPLQVGFNLTNDGVFMSFLVIGVVLSFAFGYRLYNAGEIPLVTLLLKGDIPDAQFLRRQTNLSSGTLSEIFDTIFSSGTIHWMSYGAYVMFATTKKSKWLLLFAFLFVFSIAFCISNTSISPVVIYLAAFVIIRSLLGRKAVHPYELVLVGMLLIRLFVSFKGAEGTSSEVLNQSVFARIMFGQMVGVHRCLEVFPAQIDFIWFKSTGKVIHEVFGLPTSPSYGIVTMQHYNPIGVAAGTAGHLTTIFMGEAWANFGYFGVLVAPLWVGAVVQAVNLGFLTRPKSAVAIATYAYLSLAFGYNSDFLGFYYPIGLLFFLTGITLIVMLARVFSGK